MKYGIKNAYYQTKNGIMPVRLPGAVSFNADSNSEILTKKIRLGSGIIIEKPVKVSENSTKISLAIAELPIQFITDLFGYEMDGAGVLIEHQQTKAIPFSLLFETNNLAEPCRMLYYECYCKKPQINVSTVGETVSLNARSLDIIATGDPVSASVTKSQNETVFNNWFDGVY